MRRILGAVIWWFLAGFWLAVSLGGSTRLGWQVGLGAVIFIALYLSVVILPSRSNRVAFFVGVFEGQEGYSHIGCIWVVPLAAIGWSILILLGRALVGLL